MEGISAASPRSLARIAGGLYLVNIVLGFFAIGYVPAALVVTGDAAATAHNIQANELLYRFGLVAHIVILCTNVPLVVIFYDLFRVVNRRLTLLLVFFSIVGTSMEGANLTSQFVPLMLLGGQYSGSFSAAQLQALASVPVYSLDVSYAIFSVFFGFYGLAIGYLVFKSTFLPRAIGVLLAIGASCYMTYSFAIFLAPGFASHLVPYIQVPSLIGEGSFCIWLLLAGVNVRRWKELGDPDTSRLEWAR